MADTYFPGQYVTIDVAALDIHGAAADPAALTLRVQPPTGDAVEYVYGVDPEVIRDGTGAYHADILLSESGAWSWRWEATAPAAGVVEGTLLVARSALSGDRSALFPSAAGAVAALRANQLVVSAGSLFPGVEISDDYLWSALLAAEADASRQLRVFLEPVHVFAGDPTADEIAALDGARYHVEPAYDYDPDMWTGDRWSMIALRERPIISVLSYRFAYPLPGSNTFEPPPEWIRIDRAYGTVQLVPVGQAMSMPSISAWVAQMMAGGRGIPQMIRLRYTAGLTDAARHYPDLVSLVQRMAVLRIVQDAFLPQSGSVSVDGLSQSLSRDADKYHEGTMKMLAGIRESIHGIRCMVV